MDLQICGQFLPQQTLSLTSKHVLAIERIGKIWVWIPPGCNFCKDGQSETCLNFNAFSGSLSFMSLFFFEQVSVQHLLWVKL